MVFKVFSQFIVLLLCLSISAAMPDQLSIGKGGGVFRIGGLEFRLAHFTPGYKQYTRQPGDAFFPPISIHGVATALQRDFSHSDWSFQADGIIFKGRSCHSPV